MKKNTARETYDWKEGTPRMIHRGVPGRVVGAELERIRNKFGRLDRDKIIEEAKVTKNPLHRLFEWDNDEAAHQYRLNQASNIVNHISFVVVSGGKKVQTVGFVSVKTENGRTYMATAEAMNKEEIRAQVIQEALMMLNSVRNRYQRLSEFKGVWKEIDRVERQSRRKEVRKRKSA